MIGTFVYWDDSNIYIEYQGCAKEWRQELLPRLSSPLYFQITTVFYGIFFGSYQLRTI